MSMEAVKTQYLQCPRWKSNPHDPFGSTDFKSISPVPNQPENIERSAGPISAGCAKDAPQINPRTVIGLQADNIVCQLKGELADDRCAKIQTIHISSYQPAVYMLMDGDVVVYVGQSINFLGRISEHFGGKTFTHFHYFTCDGNAKRGKLERELIRLLRPKYNAAIHCECGTMIARDDPATECKSCRRFNEKQAESIRRRHLSLATRQAGAA